MSRLILTLASLLVCTLALARADPIERAACITQAAEYFGQVKIDTPVMTLVAKSREFYPDVVQLIEDEVPSNEYSDALLDIGNQFGCDTITEHFQAIPQVVPCYESLNLEMDDMSPLDIVKSNPKAKEAFEAYFACIASV